MTAGSGVARSTTPGRSGLRARVTLAAALLLIPSALLAATTTPAPAPELAGVPVEFILFGLTLLGVAALHHHAMVVALSGLGTVLAYKLAFTRFDLVTHLHHEWMILVNLLGLLLGFALLAKHFEDSGVPNKLPDYLPDDWKGGLVLLVIVCVLSSFLDNIAAAMIGGTVARVVFKGRVHVGYLAGIVAASNAGGAGSVVGDTTTTMMWIDGVPALGVAGASLGAVVSLALFGVVAARQQHAFEPITRDAPAGARVDWGRLAIVAAILAGTIATNVLLDFPAVGLWLALVAGSFFRHTEWGELRGALKGTVFLLSLVLCASMMPVERLPDASWQTTLGLGFVSAIFDNIPLTKLALEQGGYDAVFLAFAVGFGGSMIWFGSSAGVALTNAFPEGRSTVQWLRHGWHVAVAYVVAFFVMLAVFGYHPTQYTRKGARPAASAPHAEPAQAH